MSKIAQHLSKIISEHCQENGIVVWYDPDSIYLPLLPQLVLPDIPLFQYHGSFFKLRYQIESMLARDELPRLLIYIPMRRQETEYAMIEAEKAGCYLAPGHPSSQFNTRLEYITQQVVAPILPGQVKEIVAKVQRGEYQLEDIDRLVESVYTPETGSLTLIHDKADPLEIVIEFLNHPEKDTEIIRKNATRELSQLIKNLFGFQLKPNQELSQLRLELLRYLLVNDFLITSELTEAPQILSQIPFVTNKPAQKNVLMVTAALRQRKPSQKLYQDATSDVEQKYNLPALEFKIVAIQKSQTFSFIEERLIQHGYTLLLKNNLSELRQQIDNRSQSFWGLLPPFNLHWTWLNTAWQFLTLVKQARQDIKNRKWTPEKLITSFVHHWHQIDHYFNELETRFHTLESSDLHICDECERALVKIQQDYTAILRQTNEIFQESLLQNGFDAGDILLQRELFSKKISSFVKANQKVVLLQVDALRYDLAVTLQNMLKENVQITIEPAIAQLPTLTPVGMAAALPQAEQYAALTTSKQKLGLRIHDFHLYSRDERGAYLSGQVGADTYTEFKLEQLIRPRKAVKEKIKAANFIWITSQEIDLLGENINSGFARRMMEALLNDLRRAVLELLKMGVERIVITADHGYLFGEELDPGDKIDAPGGETVALHRRVWIGRGGAKHPACIRVNESQVGLSGDLELVFPRGIACFKAPGGNEFFFHGGISLQEMVVPVLAISARAIEPAVTRPGTVELIFEKAEITNRFFTVQLRYEATELFAQETMRIRVLIQADKKKVGQVVAAMYGFEGSTGDVLLEKDRPNVVTILVDQDPAPASLDLIVQAVETQAVLKSVKKIPVRLTI